MAAAGTGRRVEGLHAVAAAVAAGRVHRLYVEVSRAGSDPVASIVANAARAGAGVEYVDDVRVLAETTAPQGVVADVSPLPSVSLASVAGGQTPCSLLVLDRVQDSRNVGAMARSALAAGIDALVIPTRRAAPLGAAAFKTAAGALETLRVVEIGSVAEAVRQLKALSVWTVGLEGGAPTSLFGLELLSEPVALVLGAEGSGLSRLVRDRVDVLASIPISSAVESLNVAAAATLAVFEVARVRNR